jgi:hypothetical protein
MSWNQVGQYAIADIETALSTSFTSRLAIQASNVSLLKPTWHWAGYFVQYLDIPDFGLTRIEQKHNLSLRESSLFVPTIFHPSYKLKFYKAEWIDSLTLTIFEDSMTLNSYNAAPDPNAATATTTNVALSTTSVTLIAANASRKGRVTIGNNSNQDLYISLGATASLLSYAYKIPKLPANGIPVDREIDGYNGVVSGIFAAAGTGGAICTEFV